MQLHFGSVLQQVLPLITFHPDEKLDLELETSVMVDNSNCEIDVRLSGESTNAAKHRIAVELKCYKTKASSGGKRGATDIFMKDVYEDLAILERYIECRHADEGIALVMNDMEHLVNPKSEEAKCWHYDISHGATFGPVSLTTPIGGKDVRIELKRKYRLDWLQYGSFWFLEAQGEALQQV